MAAVSNRQASHKNPESPEWSKPQSGLPLNRFSGEAGRLETAATVHTQPGTSKRNAGIRAKTHSPVAVSPKNAPSTAALRATT